MAVMAGSVVARMLVTLAGMNIIEILYMPKPSKVGPRERKIIQAQPAVSITGTTALIEPAAPGITGMRLKIRMKADPVKNV